MTKYKAKLFGLHSNDVLGGLGRLVFLEQNDKAAMKIATKFKEGKLLPKRLKVLEHSPLIPGQYSKVELELSKVLI